METILENLRQIGSQIESEHQGFLSDENIDKLVNEAREIIKQENRGTGA